MLLLRDKTGDTITAVPYPEHVATTVPRHHHARWTRWRWVALGSAAALVIAASNAPANHFAAVTVAIGVVEGFKLFVR
jgi:hypothetical protein